METAAQLKRAAADAHTYIGKIGRAQHHFGPDAAGSLHNLKVETQVHHQESPGATNYWNDRAFDAALARVIRQNFAPLAQAALDLMDADYKAARIAEKQSLLAQLAEIEALEAEAQSA
ncbi:hypothetical protein [Bordetella trematum]|uniref:hypothetical protein n=1 Tax=Bordetella trematum TaxID=123899 RepID=UPI003AF3F45A